MSQELDEQDDEKKEYQKIETPRVVTQEFIAEQTYDPDSPIPVYYNIRHFESDEITKMSLIQDDIRKVTYSPLKNATLEKRLVLLPRTVIPCTFLEAYHEGCDLALEMYDAQEDRKDEIRFLVGVCQSSWFYDRFNIEIPGMGTFAPIIALRGPSGSGKDRLMNALRLNSYRPFYDVSTRRVPSLYRPLDQWRGTLCLSEMDFGKSDETSELIHYLNCRSYGVPISRQSPDNPKHNEVFYNFGLTIVTQRRTWEDNATEDRTLPFYCEASYKEIATTELDEWIERGIELQNKLLYLRLRYFDAVKINKAERVKGVRDHRLTASVLPLLALSRLDNVFESDLLTILQTLERRRKEVKAMSKDGVLVNLFYDLWKEGLVGFHNNVSYVGKAKEKRKDEQGKDGEIVIPIQTSDIAEQLNWKSKEVRTVINSLRLHRELEKLPRVVRIDRTYRPIWFDDSILKHRFMEFVLDYQPEIEGQQEDANSKNVTHVTDYTSDINSKPKTMTDIGSVTCVTSVTNPAINILKTQDNAVSQEMSQKDISDSLPNTDKHCSDCRFYKIEQQHCDRHPDLTIIPTAKPCPDLTKGGRCWIVWHLKA